MKIQNRTQDELKMKTKVNNDKEVIMTTQTETQKELSSEMKKVKDIPYNTIFGWDTTDVPNPTIDLELKEGKEYLETFCKYQSDDVSTEEHLSKDLNISFYNEDCDFNYGFYFNFSDENDLSVYLKNGMTEENILNMCGENRLSVKNLYDQIQRSYDDYMKYGSVSDIQQTSSDLMFRLWLKTEGYETLKMWFDKGGVKPPNSLFKNLSNKYTDIMFRIKKVNKGYSIRIDNREELEKCTTISKVISKDGMSREEFNEMDERIMNNYMGKTIGIKKVGRNELCPCGSGIKFKKCCLN
jgi:hypothetical protein